MKTAENTTSQSDDKARSDEAIKFEERNAELERKIKYKAEIAATTQKQDMSESTAKMRSERIVAGSEHEELRLVAEAAAAGAQSLIKRMEELLWEPQQHSILM